MHYQDCIALSALKLFQIPLNGMESCYGLRWFRSRLHKPRLIQSARKQRSYRWKKHTGQSQAASSNAGLYLRSKLFARQQISPQLLRSLMRIVWTKILEKNDYRQQNKWQPGSDCRKTSYHSKLLVCCPLSKLHFTEHAKIAPNSIKWHGIMLWNALILIKAT